MSIIVSSNREDTDTEEKNSKATLEKDASFKTKSSAFKPSKAKLNTCKKN